MRKYSLRSSLVSIISLDAEIEHAVDNNIEGEKSKLSSRPPNMGATDNALLIADPGKLSFLISVHKNLKLFDLENSNYTVTNPNSSNIALDLDERSIISRSSKKVERKLDTENRNSTGTGTGSGSD